MMDCDERSKKKLLFIIPSLGGGGAERVFINLISHLDTAKYEIAIVLFDKRDDYKKQLHSAIKIIYLHKNNRWDFLKLIFGLRAVMRDFKPAAAVSFIDYVNFITVTAALFLKRKPRVIVCVHNYPFHFLRGERFIWLKKLLMRVTYKIANEIVTVSEAIKKALEERLNIEGGKIKVIYNPIDVETVRNEACQEIKHPFFDGGGKQVIISAGRLEERKRFDRLLKAFAIVKQKQNNIRLIILGEGSLGKKLKDMTSRLNIEKDVYFAGFQNNPYAWFSKADIFVLSSDTEGLPMVILEAMACGLPVVSTDCVSGPNEIIAGGENGLLVKRLEENALAEAMITLLGDKKLRDEFSRQGRKRAEDFRIEKIISRYEDLF